MNYIILRSGCHECGQPVEIIGCFSELDDARAAARDHLKEGSDWRDVDLEVWSCKPGSVEIAYTVSFQEWKNEVVEREEAE